MTFTLDAFTPRVLTAGVKKIGNGQKNFLLQRVFNRRNTNSVRIIDFGELIDNIKLSGYSRGVATPVDKLKGNLKTFKAPQIRLSKDLDENFFTTLNPGVEGFTGPYSDPMQQASAKIVAEQTSLRSKVERQIEVTAADALLDGSATIAYPDGTSILVDYGYITTGGAANTVQPARTGTNSWASKGSNPFGDVQDLIQQIYDYSAWDGGIDVIMGSKASRAFFANENVQKMLDKNVLNLGTVSMAEQAMFVGRIGAINFFTYIHSYQNASGGRAATWDENTIAVLPAGGPAEIFSIEYGAVWECPTEGAMPTLIPTNYFSKIIVEKNPVKVELIVESDPLPIIKMPEAIRIQKVIASE